MWRNGEAGARHAAEFTMLEWYRPDATMADLMDETEALLRAVLPPRVRSAGVETDLEAPFERLTVAEAFARHAGADLLGTLDDAPGLAGERRRETTRRGGVGGFCLPAVAGRVETRIGRERPTFLTHYPAAQAALARRDPADPRVAERFELFVCGIELANACVELTDAAEQRSRFETDRARRAELYGRQDWEWTRISLPPWPMACRPARASRWGSTGSR